jgi:hypothetical protein
MGDGLILVRYGGLYVHEADNIFEPHLLKGERRRGWTSYRFGTRHARCGLRH